MGPLRLPAVTGRTTSTLWRAGLFPASLGRKFGESVAAGRLVPPGGEFGPQDPDLSGGVEAQPHAVAADLDHGQGDAVADDDLLAGLPAEDQRGAPP